MVREQDTSPLPSGSTPTHTTIRSQWDTKLNSNVSVVSQTSTMSRANGGGRLNAPSAAAYARRQASHGSRYRARNGTQFGGTQLAPINEVEPLTAGFRQLQFSNNMKITPSDAPGRSTMVADWRSPSRATTQLTSRTQAQWIHSPYCTRSPFTRRHFKRGQIVSLPFHQPNLAEDVDPADRSLTVTNFGPVYSKRRMAMVLWRYKSEMMCLPLYSWGERGITTKPDYLWDQYMEVTNVGPESKEYEVTGRYDVLQARMKHPLVRGTCLCLAAGFRVDYQENLLIVGSLTEDSTREVVTAWNNLKDELMKEKF